jgi:DNA-directed RNA polymerase specialized sigma24 family protein
MAAEWRTVGRTGLAVRALHEVARRDPGLAGLVFGDGDRPPVCPTPCDLVAHMRRASGRAARDEAARLVRVLLREAGTDPFIPRLLIQVLVPGLVSVAGKLRWGRGGDWQDAEEFFGELLTTAWCVVAEWAGQDRRYAVLDLLSAIRCRLRRQLFRSKDLSARVVALGPDDPVDRTRSTETLLDELARTLVDHGAHDEMPLEELQVIYAHSVLGYSIAELAVLTGRDRRALYTRRDRARRRLCA